MTTSILQWKGAQKEDPPREGWYFAVLEGCDALDTVYLVPEGENGWKKFVEFWAEIPTAEQVRQKFRDEEMKSDG